MCAISGAYMCVNCLQYCLFLPCLSLLSLSLSPTPQRNCLAYLALVSQVWQRKNLKRFLVALVLTMAVEDLQAVVVLEEGESQECLFMNSVILSSR